MVKCFGGGGVVHKAGKEDRAENCELEGVYWGRGREILYIGVVLGSFIREGSGRAVGQV